MNDGVTVCENGIRIKYNNKQLAMSSCIKEYEYITIKNDKTKIDEINERIKNKVIPNKEIWIDISKTLGIEIEEFTESDMLISWDSVESWTRTTRRLSTFEKHTYTSIEIKIKNIETPFYTFTMFTNAYNYFKQAIPEKRIGKFDKVTFKNLFYLILILYTIFMVLKVTIVK